VPTPPKNGYDAAERAAQTLRADVINAFAQIERAIGTVLAHAATLPEYKALKPAFPHLLGQKLDRLRKLIREDGPLKSQTSEVAPLVEQLVKFEELRQFMAHGVVEVALKQSGEPIYEFHMMRNLPDGLGDSTLFLTRPKAQSDSARLTNIAKRLVAKLEEGPDGKAKRSA
jgi:hypothetical protein